MDEPLPMAPDRRRLVLSLVNGWVLGMPRGVATALTLAALGSASRTEARTGQAVAQSREVRGFSEVVFAAAGELHITQGQRERLTIEAEPEVLPKITSEVRGRRLTLGFTAGNVIARMPIRFRLEVARLHVLELQTSGTVHVKELETVNLALLLTGSGDIGVERLRADHLDLMVSGSGTVSIARGHVDSQRIRLDGAGTVRLKGLASRNAEVSIDGSGDVQLTATDRLAAQVGGSGSVRFSGNPRLVQSITGAGTIEREQPS